MGRRRELRRAGRRRRAAVDDAGSEATGRRGLEEVDRRGWDASWSSRTSSAWSRPRTSLPRRAIGSGDRARARAGVERCRPARGRRSTARCCSGIQSLLRTDPRTFVQAALQDDRRRGRRRADTAARRLVDEWLRRVPMDVAEPFYEAARTRARKWEQRLARLDVPMLLAQHTGCLMFTDEGFEDAVAALPDAQHHPLRREAEHEPGVRAGAARVLHEPRRPTPAPDAHGQDLAGRVHHRERRRARSRRRPSPRSRSAASSAACARTSRSRARRSAASCARRSAARSTTRPGNGSRRS